MLIDPIEKSVGNMSNSQHMEEDEKETLITHCETSDAWIEFRNKLTAEMFTSWIGSNS